MGGILLHSGSGHCSGKENHGAAQSTTKTTLVYTKYVALQGPLNVAYCTLYGLCPSHD